MIKCELHLCVQLRQKERWKLLVISVELFY